MAEAVQMKLAELASCSDSHQQLVVRYSQLLSELIAAEESSSSSSSSSVSPGQLQEGLQYFIRHVVNDSVSLVISRQLLVEVANYTTRLPDQISERLAVFTLNAVQARAISFEEQLTSMRHHLSGIFEREQRWREAAAVLSGIPLESGRKQYSSDYRLETYIRIARLYLEDEDAVGAETYITRASVLQAETKDEQLSVLYKVCYARILDHRRKFIEAAQRYLDLSYRPIVDKQERLTALNKAVICTILSSSGRQRSRMLASLFKDERCQYLPAHAILEKMYLGRIIGRSELSQLDTLLHPHQRGVTADGCSLLERAVVEHNIVSASRVYSSIAVSSLAALLGVSPERAEAVVGQMVCEERLQGSLDQISGVLQFGREPPLEEWHHQLAQLCGQVNSLVDKIAAESPQWLRSVVDSNTDLAAGVNGTAPAQN